MSILDSRIPDGPLAEKWDRHKERLRLVNPANRRKLDIIIVGTGLSGASAASALGEMGYNVKVFCFQDSPRRAHSVAAQGGTSAAKNYKNDNDSVYRLFYDMIKGGDFRSREANTYRAAQVSRDVIDHFTAVGVPFARQEGGTLETRSFGGVQVSRTFYAKGLTGQQMLLGAYSTLNRQVAAGTVTVYARREMLNIVKVEGRARGIIVRNLVTGELERHAAHAVVLATGGYGTVYYYSTLALNSNGSAAWAAYRNGAFFGNPSFIQIHPTGIPMLNEFQSKLTLMSESLRNDGRIWVPKAKGDTRRPGDIPEDERDYYLERRYPSFGNLVSRDVASRAAKERCDAGYGVGPGGQSVYLDFGTAKARLGEKVLTERYGNLFEMYEKIVGDNPLETPMRIYPSGHYTMGGLWVDYNLMTTVPGLFSIGESNFSDQGANRLGSASLMQTSGDGYFILPLTIADYLSDQIAVPRFSTDTPEFVAAEQEARAKIERLMAVKGTKSASSFHKRLGKIMWEYCGMSRNEAGLRRALVELDELEDEFWRELCVPGTADGLNQELEKAGRVADYFGIGRLMCHDALSRGESCGAHFREESQTETGEAQRIDEEYSYVSAWEFKGDREAPVLHKEELTFEYIQLAVRSYK